MALVGRRDGRNFGYGRQLSYAGPQALRDLYGGGHYGTVKAHSDRWQTSVRWCRSEDWPELNDACGKLIGRPCWTTPDICVSRLNMASLPPRKIGCPQQH